MEQIPTMKEQSKLQSVTHHRDTLYPAVPPAEMGKSECRDLCLSSGPPGRIFPWSFDGLGQRPCKPPPERPLGVSAGHWKPSAASNPVGRRSPAELQQLKSRTQTAPFYPLRGVSPCGVDGNIRCLRALYPVFPPMRTSHPAGRGSRRLWISGQELWLESMVIVWG